METREQHEANWHREEVGGLWDEMGKLQFDFLLAQGMKPYHYLLDIGCGSLRGGVRFIAYLEPGHYFGVDKSNELLDAGRMIELVRYELSEKQSTLVQKENFDFSDLGRQFDYALAQSVFTHLPLNSIIRCVRNVEQVLVPAGRFYATFFENRLGKFNLSPIMYPRIDGPDGNSFFDADPYHYDFETFQWICRGTNLVVKYIGDWGHPSNQKILAFTRKTRSSFLSRLIPR